MAIIEKNPAAEAFPVVGGSEVPSELATAARGLEDQARLRQETVAAAARRDSDRPAAPRKRRSSLGGAALKLEVFGTIDGYHLYWENDDTNRIEILLNEGFDYVKPSEVGMERAAHRIVADGDITDRVSKFVGTTEEGKPMRAYLMKCPNELWEEIQDSIHDLTTERDRDILEAHNRSDDRYQPKGYQSKIQSGRR